MVENLIELAYKLTQADKPFVLATVVWCERPTSAKPGAQAIIQADGTITGWIGGSCAQPVVLRLNLLFCAKPCGYCVKEMIPISYDLAQQRLRSRELV